MRVKTLKIALIALAACAILPASSVFASTLAQQLDESTSTASYSEWVQYLSTATSSDFQGTFDTISARLLVNTSSTLTMQVAPLSSCSDTAGLNTGLQNLILTTTDTLSTSTFKTYTFSLASPTSTIAGNCYGMRVQKTGGARWAGSSDGDSYPYGILRASPGGASDAVADGYFRILNLSGFTGSNDVSIKFPTNNTELVGDFAAFTLQYNAGAGSHTFYIDIATSSPNLTATSTRTTYSTGIDIADQVYNGVLQIIKSDYPLTNGGIYYARARLDSIATSDTIAFSIGGGGYIDNVLTGVLAPEQAAVCDDDSGWFSYSLCRLFVPDPSVWNNFARLKDDIESKPPFGYVSAITSLLTFSTTSTSTIDVSGLNGLTAFDEIKNFISTMLWLVFAFWVFNRFSRFIF